MGRDRSGRSMTECTVLRPATEWGELPQGNASRLGDIWAEVRGYSST
jgi:hypothetical protein